MTQSYDTNKNTQVFYGDFQSYRYSPGNILPGASTETEMVILTTFFHDNELKKLTCAL